VAGGRGGVAGGGGGGGDVGRELRLPKISLNSASKTFIGPLPLRASTRERPPA
jgi:hypothetical protein